MLSTGSRDRSILQRDIRAPEDFQTSLKGHRSEVRLVSFPAANSCTVIWPGCTHAITTCPIHFPM